MTGSRSKQSSKPLLKKLKSSTEKSNRGSTPSLLGSGVTHNAKSNSDKTINLPKTQTPREAIAPIALFRETTKRLIDEKEKSKAEAKEIDGLEDNNAGDKKISKSRFSRRNFSTKNIDEEESVLEKEQALTHVGKLEGYSFFLFSGTNRFRQWCASVVYNKKSDHLILFCIIISILTLQYENPQQFLNGLSYFGVNVSDTVYTSELYTRALYYIEEAITIIFTIETFFRMMTIGVFLNEGSYLRNPWFRLDFIVVVFGWITLLTPLFVTSNEILKVVRILRALRPWRALRFFAGIRTIMVSLRSSVPLLGNVVLFMFFLLSFFAVVGNQIFQNSASRYCVISQDPSDYDHTLGEDATSGVLSYPAMHCAYEDQVKGFQCIGEKTSMSEIGQLLNHTMPGSVLNGTHCVGGLENPIFDLSSFDNFGVAFITVFQVSTLEGWTDIAYTLQQSEYITAPFYLITVVIMVNFLVVNLFVAVISDTFGRVRRVTSRTSAFGDETSVAAPFVIKMVNGELTAESNVKSEFHVFKGWKGTKFVNYMNKLVTSNGFDYFMSFLIFLNASVLAMKRDRPSKVEPIREFVIGISEAVFTQIFALEAILKIIGLRGFRNYWAKAMNRLDFYIVIFTEAAIIVEFSASYGLISTGFVQQLDFLGIFRMIRLVRLLRQISPLKILLEQVLGSFVGILNLTFFIMFSLLVFGILGMQIYNDSNNGVTLGDLDRLSQRPPLDPRFNFNTFFDSVLSLFIVLAGDNWTNLLFDTLNLADPLTRLVGTIFVIVFFIFGNYIILNLFVAVILENFELSEDEKRRKQLENFLKKKRKDIEKEVAPPKNKGLISHFARWVKKRSGALTIKSLPRQFVPTSLRRRFVKNFFENRNPENSANINLSDFNNAGLVQIQSRENNNSLNFGGSLRRKRDSKRRPSLSGAFSDMQKRSTPRSTTTSPDASEMMKRPLSTSPDAESLFNDVSENIVEEKETGNSSLSVQIPVLDTSTIVPMSPRNSEKGDRTSSFSESRPTSARNSRRKGERRKSHRHSESMAIGGSMRFHSKVPISSVMGETDISSLVKQRYTEDSDEYIFTKSLLLLSPSSKIRKFCISIVHWNPFDHLILVAIIASSILLAFESPDRVSGPESQNWVQAFFIGDVVFLVIFTLEFLLKIVADGFILPKESYWRDSWNRIDLIVLLFSYVAIADRLSIMRTTFGDVGDVARAFRIGRTLRPLRLVNRMKNMQAILESLYRSLPAFAKVFLLSGVFLFFWALVGMQLFIGKLYKCSDESLEFPFGIQQCYGEHLINVENTKLPGRGTNLPFGAETLSNVYPVPTVWSKPISNFDNFGRALVTLFEVVNLEGWTDIMRSTMDITQRGFAPKQDYSWYNAFYFVLVVLSGSFFMLKLFIGVIIDSFNTFWGTALLTEQQRTWRDLHKKLNVLKPTAKPPPPYNRLRLYIYNMLLRPWFEKSVMIMVLINMIQLALSSSNTEGITSVILSIMDLFFIIVFTIEMMLKIIALDLEQYLRSAWNSYDASITILAIPFELAMVLGDAETASLAILAARPLRILRVLRIVKRNRGLRTLFNTLYLALPSIGNIFSLLFLLFFVYAVVGMQLFGTVKYGDAVTRHANFSSFGVALFTLFRVSTGENWNAIMKDTQITEPFCTGQDYLDGTNLMMSPDCGGKTRAWGFFISFYLLGVFILLNLFIAVILDNFSSTYNRATSAINDLDLKQFKVVWSRYDRNSIGWLSFEDVQEVVASLGAPLGVDPTSLKESESGLWEYIMEELRLACDPWSGDLSFQTVLQILALKEISMESFLPEERVRRKQEVEEVHRQLAATIINRCIRGFLVRHRFRKLVKYAIDIKRQRDLKQGKVTRKTSHLTTVKKATMIKATSEQDLLAAIKAMTPQSDPELSRKIRAEQEVVNWVFEGGKNDESAIELQKIEVDYPELFKYRNENAQLALKAKSRLPVTLARLKTELSLAETIEAMGSGSLPTKVTESQNISEIQIQENDKGKETNSKSVPKPISVNMPRRPGTKSSKSNYKKTNAKTTPLNTSSKPSGKAIKKSSSITKLAKSLSIIGDDNKGLLNIEATNPQKVEMWNQVFQDAEDSDLSTLYLDRDFAPVQKYSSQEKRYTLDTNTDTSDITPSESPLTSPNSSVGGSLQNVFDF